MACSEQHKEVLETQNFLPKKQEQLNDGLSGSSEMELLGHSTASKPRATNPTSYTDKTGATCSPVNPARNSSPMVPGRDFEDGSQSVDPRRKQVAEDRALWESTLPKTNVDIGSTPIDRNYTFIEYEDTPEKDFRIKQKKADFFETPRNLFRNN